MPKAKEINFKVPRIDCSAEPPQKAGERAWLPPFGKSKLEPAHTKSGGTAMSVLVHIGTEINYSPENTSYANSYFRCLLDWSHYRSQHTVGALALDSQCFDGTPKWRSLLERCTSLTIHGGDLFNRVRNWSFLHRWMSVVPTVRNFFHQPDHYAEIAEESAQSCLAGLSRISVTSDRKGTPQPLAETDIFKILGLKPEPLLLTSGNLN
jgi:hypothetical protein